MDREGRSRRWTERLVGADEGGHPDGWMVKEADSWTARKPDSETGTKTGGRGLGWRGAVKLAKRDFVPSGNFLLSSEPPSSSPCRPHYTEF